MSTAKIKMLPPCPVKMFPEQFACAYT